jgi:hypothetical protein
MAPNNCSDPPAYLHCASVARSKRDQQHPHPSAAQASLIANNAAGPAAPAPKRGASVAHSTQCCGTSSTRTQALRKRRAQQTMLRDQQHPHPSAAQASRAANNAAGPAAPAPKRLAQQTMLRDQQHPHPSAAQASRAANNAAGPAAPAPKRCASVSHSKQCCRTSSTRTQALRKRLAQQTMLRDQQHPHPSAAQAPRAANKAAGPAAIRAPKRLSSAAPAH